ncbi:hypothetical protein BKA70DRAFT_1573804 [Coprinopsis sp. MPI-PUGE-AT-0042]|nr:hypothetical protein BKA70DRAFT_1573804 [Coprinopsis sp. MPI-PUGE-AT-0042]
MASHVTGPNHMGLGELRGCWLLSALATLSTAKGLIEQLDGADILDLARFWEKELARANKGRAFVCSFSGLTGTRNGSRELTIQWLNGDHVFPAIKLRGKRFGIVRDPWAKSEWTGRCSGGSKEWSSEWLEVIPNTALSLETMASSS